MRDLSVKHIITSLMIAFLLFLFNACKHDSVIEPDDGNFPPDIAEIMINDCATPGCHNTQSKDAASGLDLSSWDKMFEQCLTSFED